MQTLELPSKEHPVALLANILTGSLSEKGAALPRQKPEKL
jgi:hypothetical protein